MKALLVLEPIWGPGSVVSPTTNFDHNSKKEKQVFKLMYVGFPFSDFDGSVTNIAEVKQSEFF